MNSPASTGGNPRRNRSFPDPMTYYHEHHLGQTRRELLAENPRLYACLQRDRLLWLIPLERSPAPAKPPRGSRRPRRSFPDLMAYYQEHYAGLTRGELLKRDPSFYQLLRLRGLLRLIPLQAKRDLADPLAYYQEHYAGLTRGELLKRDPSLYQLLRRDGLLAPVPLK